MNDFPKESPETKKIIRLVEFLTRIVLLRTKTIKKVDDYQNQVFLKDVPKQKGCFTPAWGPNEEYDPDVWVEIQTPREPAFPLVPPICKDWVETSSLSNKEGLPKLLSVINRQIKNPDWAPDSTQPEFILTSERLEDFPEVQREWNRYGKEKWSSWSEEHNAWARVHKVYSAFFAIHQEQIRLGEEYELVLGMGLLTWQTPAGQRVRRHLLVADAILEFEARLGKFTLRPHTEGAKLRPELDMLDVQEQPAGAEEAAKASLKNGDDDPFEKTCVEGVLQALVNSMLGEYFDSIDPKTALDSPKPIVEVAPALILRKRSSRGLTETLRRIKEQIETGGKIPVEFADLCEVRTHIDCEFEEGSGERPVEFDGEVFFPMPSNEEQRRIVQKIRVANGVLVQGPPGTGKSPTIANLICHLLATGNRILVTAKTPRALQVLNGLVPPELGPLCINLLGSGLEERQSLEASVGGILRKYEGWNENQARREQEILEGSIRQLREEKTKIDRRIRDIRESETHSQSIAEGTYRGTAARIAEAVNKNMNTYEWFIDSVNFEKPRPINESELRSILTGLRYFTSEKRQELSLECPKTLPSLDSVTKLFEDEARALKGECGAEIGADERAADMLANSDPQTIETIQEALSAFQNTRKKLLSSPHSWIIASLSDSICGQTLLWRQLSHATKDSIASIEAMVNLADDNSIEFPENTNVRALFEDACILREHIKNGGKLGWWLFRSKVVKDRIYVIETVRANGRQCSTLDDFAILSDVLRVRLECEKAWGFWVGRSEKTPGPYTIQLTALKAMFEALDNALRLEELLEKCRAALKRSPEISEPLWSDEAKIEMLIRSCRLALARQRRRSVVEDIRRIEAPLTSLSAGMAWHQVTVDLLKAIRQRCLDGFAQALKRANQLNLERQTVQKLDEDVQEMRGVIPLLTRELIRSSGDDCWDERFQQIQNAWNWKRARGWVEEYIRKDDFPSLSKRTKQIEDEINSKIAKLASLKAWSICLPRFEENHRRHMEAWQQSMKRLGKGTGKHAPRHRREAQGHLNECREAVPAWVMPLHRVWDTVKPAPGMFEVIIVDEASQCGVEALPLFYLGKKILIVGDDKQISPEAVGLPRDSVHRLMKELLDDFQFKSSFDVESSLFDQGKLRYGTQRIALQEHFRCMPEIIQFSNDLCYSDTPLIPLRQYGPNRLNPLEHVFVSEGYREGANSFTINRPEANAIVEKIAQLCSDARYANSTMGVVVLQGEAQAELIEVMLLERIGAEEIERRRLVCGNPYSFQGDERDIMFLSLVAASNERIGPLSNAAAERRFNVAASRARDQMFLFHSVKCDDLSASCLRRRLLEFFEGMKLSEIAGVNREDLERRAKQDNRSVIKPPTPFESWFEVDVALELGRKGFRVIPQFEIAGKRIDLVVEGGKARLAVECDGDNWHGPDRYEADMLRQRQLERCNWVFFRVRESAFYSNKKNALQGLWNLLEEREIFPCGEREPHKTETDKSNSKNDEEAKCNPEHQNKTGRPRIPEENLSEEENLSSCMPPDVKSSSEIQALSGNLETGKNDLKEQQEFPAKGKFAVEVCTGGWRVIDSLSGKEVLTTNIEKTALDRAKELNGNET